MNVVMDVVSDTNAISFAQIPIVKYEKTTPKKYPFHFQEYVKKIPGH